MPIRYTAGNYKYQLKDDYIITVPLVDAKVVSTPYLSVIPLDRYSTSDVFAFGLTVDMTDKTVASRPIAAELTIRAGYAWDGPSGPTYDSKDSMRGSLVHDALYQLIRLGHLGPEHRQPADQLLYDICREDGMGYFRANAWYWAVRMFGRPASEPNSGPKEYTAP